MLSPFARWVSHRSGKVSKAQSLWRESQGFLEQVAQVFFSPCWWNMHSVAISFHFLTGVSMLCVSLCMRACSTTPQAHPDNHDALHGLTNVLFKSACTEQKLTEVAARPA